VHPPGARAFPPITVDDLAMQTPTRVVVNWPALLKNGDDPPQLLTLGG
jgi:hypothetical protein